LLHDGAGDEPFLAINGDIWTDFDLALLPREPTGLAHLLLVDNPPQHPGGDFGLDTQGRIHPYPDSPSLGALRALTFAGIGVYRPALLASWRAVIGDKPGADETPPRFGLAPLLRAAMTRDQATADFWHGAWTDVGTPQRLAQIDAEQRS
jgi:MurNAc alpha-1-phosphate uridylyltransferase